MTRMQSLKAEAETKVQAKIIAHLEGLRCYVVKTISTNKAGTPDLIICTPKGFYVAIEVKSTKGTLSALQAVKLKQINACRGVGLAVYGYADYLVQFEQYIAELC